MTSSLSSPHQASITVMGSKGSVTGKAGLMSMKAMGSMRASSRLLSMMDDEMKSLVLQVGDSRMICLLDLSLVGWPLAARIPNQLPTNS